MAFKINWIISWTINLKFSVYLNKILSTSIMCKNLKNVYETVGHKKY
jgi:hypothetical protein